MSNLSGLRNSLLLQNPLAFAIAGAAIGIVAWSGHVAALPLSLGLMALLRPAATFLNRLFLTTSYFAGAMWPILPGSSIFYGNDFEPLHTVRNWIAVSILLALPWALLTGSSLKRLAWSVPLCLIVESVPPFAVIGLANPLVSAGALFPHAGWFGLILTLLLATFVAIRPLPAVAAVAALSIIAPFIPQPNPVPGWQGIDTNYGGAGVDSPDAIKIYSVAENIQQTALDSNAQVIVFPESVVYRWTPTTDLFWKRTLDTLKAQGKTIVVGAMTDLPGDRYYLNVAVVRGDTHGVIAQRIPVPIAMWKPFTHDGSGTLLNIFGRTTASIHGQRAAIVICYEQLLVWPMIRSFMDRPTVLIGMANDFWARDTNFDRIQAATLQSWSRLFNTPVVSAVNR
jgi:apolipoprotein N-acyltransferase